MPMQRMGDDIAYVNDIHLARIEMAIQRVRLTS